MQALILNFAAVIFQCWNGTFDEKFCIGCPTLVAPIELKVGSFYMQQKKRLFEHLHQGNLLLTFSFSTQKDQSRFSYNLESPVVVTRTGPQLEMVEPIQIPDHKLPLNNVTNELERLMAITAHP